MTKPTALALISALALTGCATSRGPGDALAITSSPGAVVIDGDVVIVKQFGADCAEARSGLNVASDAESEQGLEVGVDAPARSGELGASAGAALVGALAALDTCGESGP